LLDVKNLERTSVLQLGCAEGVGTKASLSIGGRTGRWSLQQLSPDQLFLAFDSSELPAGCSLEAVVDNGREGRSRPFSLARLVRLPMIDSFTVTADRPSGLRQYQLTGENLEMIQKIGWTESEPVEVNGLPAPLPGPGLKQTLELGLSDPPKPGATLWIWLRGDQEPRAANIRVSNLLADAEPQPERARRALAAAPASNKGGRLLGPAKGVGVINRYMSWPGNWNRRPFVGCMKKGVPGGVELRIVGSTPAVLVPRHGSVSVMA
jgi:hypothetical protein